MQLWIRTGAKAIINQLPKCTIIQYALLLVSTVLSMYRVWHELSGMKERIITRSGSKWVNGTFLHRLLATLGR